MKTFTMAAEKCLDCSCDYYCRVLADAKSYEKLNNNVNDNGTNEFWKNSIHFHESKTLQFHGMEITLQPDGTYQLSDTTGG